MRVSPTSADDDNDWERALDTVNKALRILFPLSLCHLEWSCQVLTSKYPSVDRETHFFIGVDCRTQVETLEELVPAQRRHTSMPESPTFFVEPCVRASNPRKRVRDT